MPAMYITPRGGGDIYWYHLFTGTHLKVFTGTPTKGISGASRSIVLFTNVQCAERTRTAFRYTPPPPAAGTAVMGYFGGEHAGNADWVSIYQLRFSDA